MTSKWDHNRARNKTISFWATSEEYRQLQARIIVSGLSKSEYMIQSMLGNPIFTRIGKFESDRLSVEFKKLAKRLDSLTVPEEVVPLLLECRALLAQIIKITQDQVKEENENG